MADRHVEALAAIQRMSVEEAGARLGVSKFTVRALIRRREIGILRVGRRIVIDARDLAEFERRCRVPARLT